MSIIILDKLCYIEYNSTHTKAITLLANRSKDMEIIGTIILTIAALAVPLVLFTYMREDMDVLLMAIALAVLITALWANNEENKNAEFEAKNCPEMLKIDSKLCKAKEQK